MMSLDHFLYFLGASMLLTLAPGPDILFVMTQGISNGRKPAVITALGLCSGITVHTTAAALGVSAIFHTSALAFNLVKWAGAAYLFYLAWKIVSDKGGALKAGDVERVRLSALFKRGILMNVMNPKVSLFFLAFLPQFVSPETGRVAGQMIVLGLVFMLQAILIFSTVGVFAGAVGEKILQRPGVSRALGWVSASVFVGLGLRLALARR